MDKSSVSSHQVSTMPMRHAGISDIAKFLDSPNLSLKKVLQNPNSIRYILSDSPHMKTFLNHNIDDLLRITFDYKDPLSNMTYQLLSRGYCDLQISYTSGDILAKSAATIFSSENPNSNSLSRIADLSLQWIISSGHTFPYNCSFTIELIKFIDQQPILAFFESIFSNPELISAQQFYTEKNIAASLLEPLKAIDDEKYSPLLENYGNPLIEKIINSLSLYRTIITKSNNPKPFLTMQLIALVFQFVQQGHKLSQIISNEIWMTISVVLTPETNNMFFGIINIVIEKCGENIISSTFVHKDKVAAFSILTKFLQIDKSYISPIANSVIWGTLGQSMQRYSDNTFVINVLLDFFRVSMHIDYLKPKIIPIVEMVVVAHPRIKETMDATSIELQFIELVLNEAKSDKSFIKKIAQFADLDQWKAVIQQRNKLLSKGYGGHVPKIHWPTKLNLRAD